MKYVQDFSRFKVTASANASYRIDGPCEFVNLDDLCNVEVHCWRRSDLDETIRASVGIVAKTKATQEDVQFKFNYAESEKALQILHVGETMSLDDYCKSLGRPLADTVVIQHFVLTDAGKAQNADRKADCYWCYPVALLDTPEE